MADGRVLLRHGGLRPLVTLGFALAYFVAGLVGRQAVLDGTTFALVWPAAGVAVLWLMVQRAGPLGVDTVALAVVSFAANFATGAPLEIAVLLMLTNTAQAVVAVALLRRWCPTLWGAGGSRSLDSPKMTAWYLGAASVGMATGMVLGIVGTQLIGGTAGPLQALLWFDRNLTGVLAITTLGLILGQRLESAPPRPSLFDSGRELLAASTFSLVMYVVAFNLEGKPLAFTLLAATVWFGVRFSTLVSGWHSLVSGSAAVVLTLAGLGPFASDTSDEVGALLVQFFVVMVLVSGVVLSTGREERRALAEELRSAKEGAEYQAQVLDTVINGVVEGLVVVDGSRTVLLANPSAVEMLDLDCDPSGERSLVGLTTAHLNGTPMPQTEQPSHRALAGETLRNVDVRFTSPQGVHRVLSLSAAPISPDAHGSPRAVIVFRDATSDFNQRAELAAFAGVVAHDLRNPLAAIDGWTELLEDEAASGDLHPQMVADFIGRVRASSERMHGLILHLLAHATSKDAALTLTQVDVADSVRRVTFARDAVDHVRVWEIPHVHADKVLIDQLLENLIGNALKFVAADVKPCVEVHGGVVAEGWVTVTVTDNGVGLPEGEHESIFDEFHRAHAATTFEGTGLGLSICRRIVTRHGGTITARDNPEGQGTVFEFTLPACDEGFGA